MACDTKNIDIDGVKIYTVQFPAEQGAKLIVKLTKTFGSLFSKLSANIDEIEIDISKFVEKLSEDYVIALIKELLAYTKIHFPNEKQPRDIDFDIDFAGEYLLLLKTCIWVVQANHFFGKGDILNGLKNLFPKMTQQKELKVSSKESPMN